jgi:hypothetical protein
MATLGSLIADDTVWHILGHSHLAGDKAFARQFLSGGRSLHMSHDKLFNRC